MEPTRMQVAYDRLREKMLAGELEPGARLVNRALGKELGISTVTVREAIHRLASEGLVEHVPNAGAFVRRLADRDVADLYRFREALEEFALQETVRRGEEHALRRLRAICDRMRDLCAHARGVPGRVISGDMHLDWLDVDLSFHHQLAASAENPWLTKTLQDLDLMGRIAATKPAAIDYPDAARTYRFHREVVRALEARDLERAVLWMRRHNGYGLEFALSNGSPRAR